MLGEYAENEIRKDFTTFERVVIGRAVEEELGERRSRPKADAPEENVQNFGQFEPRVKTDKIAAKRAGFGNPD